MDIAFLIIIFIIFMVLIFLRRSFKWGVYVIGTAEVGMRVLHVIGDNIGVLEINNLINKFIPTSLFDIAKSYTDGVLYILLFWILIILLVWFVVYLIRYLITKK